MKNGLDTVSVEPYYPLVMTGAELKREREKAGMSRTQLAAGIGRSERMIYHYEGGKVEIHQANEMALRQAIAAFRKARKTAA